MTSVLAVRLLALKQPARSAPQTPAADAVPREWLRMLETLRQRPPPPSVTSSAISLLSAAS